MDVLLVEDEAAIREVLESDLTHAGLSVVPVSNAEAGLEAASMDGASPTVLVTDVNLGPGMDGLALAAEARRRWPGLAVIVMTGEERNLSRMPAELRESCLVKPFKPPRLVQEVTNLIAQPPR